MKSKRRFLGKKRSRNKTRKNSTGGVNWFRNKSPRGQNKSPRGQNSMRGDARNESMKRGRLSDLHRVHDAEDKIEDRSRFAPIKKLFGIETSELELMQQRLAKLKQIREALNIKRADRTPETNLAYRKADIAFHNLYGKIKQREQDILYEANEAKLNQNLAQQYTSDLVAYSDKLKVLQNEDAKAVKIPDHKKAEKILLEYTALKKGKEVKRTYNTNGDFREGSRPMTQDDQSYYQRLINAQQNVVNAYIKAAKIYKRRNLPHIPRDVLKAAKEEYDEARELITELEEFVTLTKILQISIEKADAIAEDAKQVWNNLTLETDIRRFFLMKIAPQRNDDILAAKRDIIIQMTRLGSIRLLGAMRRAEAEARDSSSATYDSAYRSSIEAAKKNIEEARADFESLTSSDEKVPKVSSYMRGLKLVTNALKYIPSKISGLFTTSYHDNGADDPD